MDGNAFQSEAPKEDEQWLVAKLLIFGFMDPLFTDRRLDLERLNRQQFRRDPIAHRITFNLVGLVLGQWLVTRRHWSGFLVWAACNVYGGIACFMTGIPETSCLFAAYLIVNLGSLRVWMANDRRTRLRPSVTEPSR